MAMQKLSIGTIVAIALIGVVTTVSAANMIFSTRISSTGSVKSVGVGVYWDYSCTNPVSSLDWGALEAGDTKDHTVYLRNEGNVPITLSMTAENWEPSSAPTYMTLQWTRQNYVLPAGSRVSAKLTLSISQNINDANPSITSFGFDVVIEGTET